MARKGKKRSAEDAETTRKRAQTSMAVGRISSAFHTRHSAHLRARREGGILRK
jgi:hypothetical protein